MLSEPVPANPPLKNLEPKFAVEDFPFEVEVSPAGANGQAAWIMCVSEAEARSVVNEEKRVTENRKRGSRIVLRRRVRSAAAVPIAVWRFEKRWGEA